MRKFSPNLFDDAPPRRRSRTPVAITILLGLLLSPLVYRGHPALHGAIGRA